MVAGRVRQGGQELRINVELVDANNGRQIWAQQFNAHLDSQDIFATEDEIVEKVIGEIGGQHGAISRAEIRRYRGVPPENFSSYRCVLLSLRWEQAPSPNAHLEARDCLEKAVKAEPDYATAWAWLATMYSLEARFGFNLRSDQYDASEKALEAARHAVGLDPNSQVAHVALAEVSFFGNDISTFRSEAEIALRLNPNNPRALIWMGFLLANVARSVEEHGRDVALIEKGMRLNPNHPDWALYPVVWRQFFLDNNETALEQSYRIKTGTFFWLHLMRTAILGALDRKEQARSTIAELHKLYPGFTVATYTDVESPRWNHPEWISSKIADGLRKAGLPEQPPGKEPKARRQTRYRRPALRQTSPTTKSRNISPTG